MDKQHDSNKAMTSDQRALKLKRRGLGVELNAHYHADAVYWLKKAEHEAEMPALFDLVLPFGGA